MADCISYEPFCRMIMGGSAGRGPAPTRGQAGQPSTPAYLMSSRTLDRFADLKAEGRNPRDLFEAYDVDVSGVVDVWRFKEVLQRINIISPDLINEAALDFAGLAGRDTVSYDDFCRVLEVATNNAYAATGDRRDDRDRDRDRDFDVMYTRPRDSVDRGYTSSRGRDRESYGSTRNSADPLDNGNVERWLTGSASPKQRRDFESMYDDLARFKEDQQRGGSSASYRDSRDRDRDFPIALDQSTDRLRPPTISSDTCPSRRGCAHRCS